MFLFIVSAGIVALTSLVQLSAPSIFGVHVNLVMGLLASLAVSYKEWRSRLVLILLAALFTATSPTINKYTVAFIAVSFIMIAVGDVLPWEKFLNVFLSVFFASAAMDIFGGQAEILRVFYGAVTSGVIAVIIFTTTQFSYAKENKGKKHRFRRGYIRQHIR